LLINCCDVLRTEIFSHLVESSQFLFQIDFNCKYGEIVSPSEDIFQWLLLLPLLEKWK
jgi:hypothetical protein